MKKALVPLMGIFLAVALSVVGMYQCSQSPLVQSANSPSLPLAKASDSPVDITDHHAVVDGSELERIKQSLTLMEDTYMRAGGKDSDGNWHPIKVDKEGRVVCAIERQP